MPSREKIKIWLKKNLSGERYAHVLGTEETAKELAVKFAVDPEKAGLAALVHDCAKNIEPDKLLKIIEENNIDISDMEKMSKKTLNAPVSAFLAKKEFGIDDTEILDAIRWHTVGKIDMSKLDKIVFLADKIEPMTRNKEFREKILAALNKTKNLDEAILLCYDATIRSLLERRMIINPQTIEVWNDLLSKLTK